ncbi:lipopolysaccharide biosynthesis protein [Aeromonas enteropelogenes]|uniref:lipopolysaccharide biosynthesis protein n=1 Tax=Aeromonas enteropelogenes TaxID=29489 RepID=UPI003987B1AB
MIKKLGYSFLLNILNAVFPLLTLPIVFRALSPEQYGDYVIVNILYQLTIVFFNTVFVQYFIREYSGKWLLEKDANSCRYICGEYICVQIFSMLFSCIFYIGLVSTFHSFANIRFDVALWYFIPLIFSSCNVEWYYFATQNYKVLFYRTGFIKLILLFSVYFFVESSDVVSYAIIMALSYALTYIIGYLNIIKFVNFRKISLRELFLYTFKVKHFALNSIIGVGYQYGDQLLLSIILGKKELAILNILKQIYAMAMMVPTTWCRFFMPTAIQSYKNFSHNTFHKKYGLMYVAINIFIFIFIFTFGLTFLMYFAGGEYHFNRIDVLLCAMCVISTAAAVYIDTQISIPQRLESITTRSNFIVLSVFLATLYLFVNWIGYSGALISIFISEICGVLMMIYLHYRRDFKNS